MPIYFYSSFSAIQPSSSSGLRPNNIPVKCGAPITAAASTSEKLSDSTQAECALVHMLGELLRDKVSNSTTFKQDLDADERSVATLREKLRELMSNQGWEYDAASCASIQEIMDAQVEMSHARSTSDYQRVKAKIADLLHRKRVVLCDMSGRHVHRINAHVRMDGRGSQSKEEGCGATWL